MPQALAAALVSACAKGLARVAVGVGLQARTASALGATEKFLKSEKKERKKQILKWYINFVWVY